MSEETNHGLKEEDLDLLDRLYAPDNAEIIYKYKTSIKYLCQLKEPQLVLTYGKSHRVIGFLKDNSENNDELVACVLEEKSIVDVFVSSLAYYLEELKVFLGSYSKSSLSKLLQDDVQLYLEKFDFVIELIILIRNLTNKSKTLCYRFHDNHGTQVIFDYLVDDNLVKRLFKFKQRSSANTKDIGINFLLGLLGTLLNISYIADYRKKDFEELKVTEKVIHLVDLVKKCDNARLLAYVILSNVVNENEIETSLDTRHAIEDLMSLIRAGVDAIVQKENLKRIRVDVDFDEDNEIFEDVCSINDDWNILDLLLALYRLAINDNLKLVIFRDFNIKIELEKIFLNGNDTEKEYSAKLLWQLCFDKTVAKDVQESETLFAYIQSIAERNTSKRKLRFYCKGIIWSISRYEKNSQLLELTKSATNIMIRTILPTIPLNLKELVAKNPQLQEQQKPIQSSKGKHIMISYNSQSRDDCLKIKAALEKLGHTIWIDVEDISGSSLEAMANAIENSKCVLMCMTEKYKQSPNCRAVRIILLIPNFKYFFKKLLLRKPNMLSN